MMSPLAPSPVFEQLAVDACEELFAQYGIVLRRLWEGDEPVNADFTIGSIIGFSGKHVRGTLVLALTDDLPTLSNPMGALLVGAERARLKERDWVGELSNQLLGHVKVRLLRRGVEIYAHLPAVLRGRHLAPLPRVELKPLRFATLGGVIAVWLEVDLGPGFEMKPEDDDAERPLDSGSHLIFD
jgi:hypothetical protein